MTQCEQILEYMKTGASVTPLEALSRFGCFRLAARISDLRDRGNVIEMQKMSYTTQAGVKKTVASYRLIREAEA